jgi:hypothetical protein
MNASHSTKLSILALLTTMTAPAAYSATGMGPAHDAVPNCARVVRAELGMQNSPKFANRVVLTGSRQRVQSVTLTGTTSDDGLKVPFEARCERGAKGRPVAYVTHEHGTAIAEVTRK